MNSLTGILKISNRHASWKRVYVTYGDTHKWASLTLHRKHSNISEIILNILNVWNEEIDPCFKLLYWFKQREATWKWRSCLCTNIAEYSAGFPSCFVNQVKDLEVPGVHLLHEGSVLLQQEVKLKLLFNLRTHWQDVWVCHLTTGLMTQRKRETSASWVCSSVLDLSSSSSSSVWTRFAAASCLLFAAASISMLSSLIRGSPWKSGPSPASCTKQT